MENLNLEELKIYILMIVIALNIKVLTLYMKLTMKVFKKLQEIHFFLVESMMIGI